MPNDKCIFNGALVRADQQRERERERRQGRLSLTNNFLGGMAAAAESLAKRQDEHKRGTPPQSDSTGECPQARMRQLGVEQGSREGRE